jgi:hypothetical protein
MIDHLPEDVRKGLENARKASLKRSDRLCIHDGEKVYRINRFWAKGMSIDGQYGDKLRGRVEIYDGARHVYQCLIENGRTENGACVFDFKWLHPVADQPAADFVRPTAVPAGLIEKAY